VETGQLPASPEFAEACDKVLDTGGALHRLLDWRKGQVFPSWFGKWHEKEQAAITLRTYQPLLIPGLLQSERYARAVLRGDETAVAARLERQAILAREDPPAPTFRCVIDEAVLYRPIGSSDLMEEQLLRLLDAVGPRLSIQVLPHGLHSGLMGGFVLATLEGGVEVLYLETAVRGITTSDQEEVLAGIERFEAIRTEALPLNMSVEVIKKALEERWT
jgi:hypothetical protein